jgi:uncharacterized SAM-binding protein YcdF (DUF218 family)
LGFGDGVVVRAGKLIAAVLGAIAVAFVAGFFVFASGVAQRTPNTVERADGIVVLTGGSHRLAEAAKLLADGHGKRLLISGVNRVTSGDDLLRKTGLSRELFETRVDIGYEAQDTPGNAQETMEWVHGQGFRKLIIVTSSYHMPRSLTELGRAMPEITFVPYPVVPQGLRKERWWRDPTMARLLLSEYVKFLPSAARFGVVRLLRSLDGSALAGGTATRDLSL